MTILDGDQPQSRGLQDQRPVADQQSNHMGAQVLYLQTLGVPWRPVALGNLASVIQQGTGTHETHTLPDTNVPRGMFEAFINTCQRWRLEKSGQLRLLGYADHEFIGSQLLQGHMPARTQDVRDRIGYVLSISLGLGTLFNEAVAPELAWLAGKHPRLDEAPLQFMLRGRMVHLMTVADIVRIERGL